MKRRGYSVSRQVVGWALPDILQIPLVEYLRAAVYETSLPFLASLSPAPTAAQTAALQRRLRAALTPLFREGAALAKGGASFLTNADRTVMANEIETTFQQVRGMLDRYRQRVPRGKLGRPATRREMANDVSTFLQGRNRSLYYQTAFREAPGPVRRILAPVENCRTCPPKARVYPSYAVMLAEVGLPGDGSDQCHGNCQCRVEAVGHAFSQ